MFFHRPSRFNAHLKFSLGRAHASSLAIILIVSIFPYLAQSATDSTLTLPEEYQTKAGTLNEQEKQLIKDLENIKHEADELKHVTIHVGWFNIPTRVLRPEYANPGLRKETYDKNVQSAKNLILNYKSQAESRLKDPFQLSFMTFMAGLAQSFRIYDDPREPDLQAGSTSVNELETLLKAMFEKTLKVQAAVKGVNLDPQPTDSNTVAAPDPRVDIRVANTIKLANGKLAPGTTYPEKSRAYVADAFERMVRVFLAGSDQLQRDTGTKWAGKKKILGFYQGFMPDILNSTQETTLVPGKFYSEVAACGIANTMNGVLKYFKSSNDQYENEYPGKNHQCTGAGDSESIMRGDIVNALMMTMQKMQSDLKTKGKIIQASAYGVLDVCTPMRAEIAAYRDLIKAEHDSFYGGMGNQAHVKDNIECGENGQFDGNASLQGSSRLDGSQMRSCMIAAMQNSIELNLVSQYMYCTWHAVAKEVIHKSIGALLSQNEKPKTPMYWVAQLESTLSSWLISNAHASAASQDAATQAGNWDNVYSNAFGGKGTLLGDAVGGIGRFFGNLAGWSQGFMSGLGHSLGYNRVKKGDKKGQGLGVVTCSSGLGIFKTGLPPPAWPWVPVWVSNGPSSHEVDALAQLAVQSGDASDLNGGKGYIRGLSFCERKCYSVKKSTDALAQQDSSQASKYKQIYQNALGSCSGKNFISHILTANSDIQNNCTCNANLPEMPPPVQLPTVQNNLRSSRELASKLAGGQIELETPKTEDNLIGEQLPSYGAAEASPLEHSEKSLTPIVKNMGADLKPIANTYGSGLDFQGSQMTLGGASTEALSREEMHHSLDPDSGTYAAASAGKATGAPSKTGRRPASAGSALRGSGEAVTSLEFGAQGSQGALGIDDPEDYFGRIGVQDDIFKIVTRRYTTKTHQWVTEELATLPSQ